MIVVKITQLCNGCEEERLLNEEKDAEQGGWREVMDNNHLCPKCIKKALGFER